MSRRSPLLDRARANAAEKPHPATDVGITLAHPVLNIAGRPPWCQYDSYRLAQESGWHRVFYSNKFKFLAVLLLTGACTEMTTTQGSGEAGFITNLPESVVAMAAPNQNLQAVRIMPEDGCYWYKYVGPVETTYLPLRTTDGRPICTPRTS